MTREKQLTSLLRHKEAAEKEALLDKRRIEEVIDARKLRVGELEREKEQLLLWINEIRNSRRVNALQSGSVGEIQALEMERKGYEEKLKKVEIAVRNAQKELLTAQSRLTQKTNELVENRIAKQQVENVLTNRSKMNSILKEERQESNLESRSWQRINPLKKSE